MMEHCGGAGETEEDTTISLHASAVAALATFENMTLCNLVD
jgi:hypothetical protein